MTEENPGPFAAYIYTPHGSLWMDEPTFWRETPASEWEQAAEVLNSLMPLAESINNQGMIIAIGDAETRAREELKRARERESSEERDEHGHSPAEADRLQTLIHRSDALANARTMIGDHVPEGVRSTTLPWLEKLHEEAEEEVEHYKRELEL